MRRAEPRLRRAEAKSAVQGRAGGLRGREAVRGRGQAPARAASGISAWNRGETRSWQSRPLFLLRRPGGMPARHSSCIRKDQAPHRRTHARVAAGISAADAIFDRLISPSACGSARAGFCASSPCGPRSEMMSCTGAPGRASYFWTGAPSRARVFQRFRVAASCPCRRCPAASWRHLRLAVEITRADVASMALAPALSASLAARSSSGSEPARLAQLALSSSCSRGGGPACAPSSP